MKLPLLVLPNLCLCLYLIIVPESNDIGGVMYFLVTAIWWVQLMHPFVTDNIIIEKRSNC